MKLLNEYLTQLQNWHLGKSLGAVFLLAMLMAALSFLPGGAAADTQIDLQQKISDRSAQIASLEKEIAQYENDLAALGTQKTTLESEIQRLDISRKKIT